MPDLTDEMLDSILWRKPLQAKRLIYAGVEIEGILLRFDERDALCAEVRRLRAETLKMARVMALQTMQIAELEREKAAREEAAQAINERNAMLEQFWREARLADRMQFEHYAALRAEDDPEFRDERDQT